MSTEDEPLFTADPDGFTVTGAGDFTVTLPPARHGEKITVKNNGPGVVTVAAPPWPAVVEPGVTWTTEGTPAHLWPCGCLINDAGAHRVGCPDHPEGVRG